MAKHLHTLLLGLVFLFLSVPVSIGQTHIRISGSFQNQSLPTILDRLRDEYKLIFAYDVELVSEIHIKKELRSLTLEDAMKTLLEGTELEFKIVRQGQVVINRRPQSMAIVVPKPVEPQPIFRISGQVTDGESDMPLAYASVRVADSHQGASARADGRFSLQVSSPDLLTLEVGYVGYGLQRIPLVPGKDSRGLQIRLYPVLHELPEVVIQEPQSPMVVAGQALSSLRISPRQIARVSGLGMPDMLQTLRLLPGISGANEVAPGLFLRGGTPDQNLILFDGVTAYRSDHFFGLFSAFNPDATQSVEVFTGGFDARYGNRVSGVVDIRGKAGNMERVALHGGLSLLTGSLTAEIPLVKNKVSLMLAGRQSISSLYQSALYQRMLTTMLGDQTVRNQHYTNGVDLVQFRLAPAFGFSDLNVKLAVRASHRDSLTFSYYQAHDGLNYSIVADSSKIMEGETTKIVTHTDELTLRNEGLSTSWNRSWSAKLKSALTLAYSGFTNDYTYVLETETSRSNYASYISQFNQIRDLSASWDNEWLIGQQNRVDFGVRVSRQDVRHRYASDYLLLEQSHNTGTTYSAYVQSHLQPIREMEITGGLRYNYLNTTDQAYFEPRLSVSYRPAPQLRLSMATGKYYQFLNRVVLNNGLGVGEDFWALANANTIPVQQSTHVIFGMAYDSDDFLVSLESYVKNGKGLLEYLHGIYLTELDETIEGELVTGGSARARGFEFMLQKKAGLYSGWVSYSLSQVEHRFPALNGGQFFPALHDQRHEIKFVNLFSLKHWDVNATWIYASGRPYTAAIGTQMTELSDGSEGYFIQVGQRNSLRLPAYHRLDLTASYKWKLGKVRGKTGLSVYNLYNRENIRTRRYTVYSPTSRSASGQLSVADVLHLGITPNVFVNFNF